MAIGWIAGFLEGEGSFRYRATSASRPHGGSAEVSAVQVQRAPLDRLKAALGGSIYWRPTKGRGIHAWQLSGPAAIGLMMTLYPLMSPERRVRIRAAIDTWRARPGKGCHNRAKMACPKGHAYDTAVNHAGRRPTRRCSVCYAAWWKANGWRYQGRLRRAPSVALRIV